jgi:hypothetical protein
MMPPRDATAAAFAFAARLAEPAFRELLRQAGWATGDDVVVTVPDEFMVVVLRRLATARAGDAERPARSGPVFVAIERPHGGFDLIVVDEERLLAAAGSAQESDPRAITIGQVYELLAQSIDVALTENRAAALPHVIAPRRPTGGTVRPRRPD